ncbi:hypothetical protein [Lacinutrix sp.]|uniref:hypothetical protein n=1 Tax=Lacinutrix sp. TaxID=1937692 RepID=UPI002621622A|nr:hypothetical protein [Lacinutrix sp.]MDG1714233.1 hypothetical protein [Lacinutrix sp.]
MAARRFGDINLIKTPQLIENQLVEVFKSGAHRSEVTLFLGGFGFFYNLFYLKNIPM